MGSLYRLLPYVDLDALLLSARLLPSAEQQVNQQAQSMKALSNMLLGGGAASGGAQASSSALDMAAQEVCVFSPDFVKSVDSAVELVVDQSPAATSFMTRS